MASNPVVVPCPKDVWTKVADSVSIGKVDIDVLKPVYKITYRVAGDPVPPDTDLDAILMKPPGAEISADAAIDVYVKPIGKDGEVIVSL